MDASLIKAIPIPVNVRDVQGYRFPVKGAKLSGEGKVLKLSREAKDLLAECANAENLPSPIPNFLELHDANESGAFVLAKPVMEENDSTIPVTIAKDGEVKVDLFKFLLAKKIKTISGTRLVIPISQARIQAWGAALVLHMAALKWVPIGKRGEAQPEDLDQKNT